MKIFLLLIVAAVSIIAFASTVALALAPITHSHLEKPDRMKWCGADTDCVVVKEHGVGGIVKVDGLDLMKDRPSELRKKLPAWFGPRPCVFVFEHRVLDEDRPMAQSGVEIMNTIVIYEANEHQAEDLAEREREEVEMLENGGISASREAEIEDEAELTSQSSARHLKR